MGARRWLAIVLALTFLAGPVSTVAAQYAGALPAGVVAAEVDGQPIDADNTPETDDPSPQISGRINTGLPSVDLAIGDGEVVRFTAPVDERGRFRATPPEPLEPGQYSLYIFDALVGAFTVSAAAEDDRNAGGGEGRAETPDLDIARVVPFPFDFGETIPGLGLLDGRFFSLDEEARRSAVAAGDDSADAIDESRRNLRESGWQGRYESRLAVPLPDDPARFSVQVSSFAILYDTSESAGAAFGASTGSEEAITGSAIGDESEVVALSGTTPDTGAPYQALRLIYRLDRLLGMIILADLSGGEVDQDLLESVAQSVVDRGAEVLNGDAPNVSPRALRLDLTNAGAVSLEEAYEVVDGALIDLYNEDDPLRQAREATYSGTTDAYSSAVVAANGVQAGDEQTATEETGGTTVAYGSTVLAFPSPEDTEEWLSGLADRLSEDPLRGYLSFAAVSDPPIFGEGSAVYAFQRQIDDEVASGYRVYVRVGADVAAVEFATVPEASLADVEGLVEAQVACLEADACRAPVSIPGTRQGQGQDQDQPVDDAAAEDDGGAVRREGRDTEGPAAAEDPGVTDAPVSPTPAAPARGGVVDVVPTEEPSGDGQ